MTAQEIDRHFARLTQDLANEFFNGKMTRRENGKRLAKLDSDCRQAFIDAGLDPKTSDYLAGK